MSWQPDDRFLSNRFAREGGEDRGMVGKPWQENHEMPDET